MVDLGPRGAGRGGGVSGCESTKRDIGWAVGGLDGGVAAAWILGPLAQSRAACRVALTRARPTLLPPQVVRGKDGTRTCLVKMKAPDGCEHSKIGQGNGAPRLWPCLRSCHPQ